MRQHSKTVTILNKFNRIVLVIIIATPLLYIVLAAGFSKWINREDNIAACNIELQRSFSGIVDDFYYDGRINVKAFIITFTNGYKYKEPYFLKSLHGEIAIGDSVYKEKGAFIFKIFKKESKQVYVHRDTVDCNAY